MGVNRRVRHAPREPVVRRGGVKGVAVFTSLAGSSVSSMTVDSRSGTARRKASSSGANSNTSRDKASTCIHQDARNHATLSEEDASHGQASPTSPSLCP